MTGDEFEVKMVQKSDKEGRSMCVLSDDGIFIDVDIDAAPTN